MKTVSNLCEYTDQQIALWPTTVIFVSMVTSREGEISTMDAPYAGSVIMALLSSPRKDMLKSMRSPDGRETTGVVEMEPSHITG